MLLVDYLVRNEFAAPRLRPATKLSNSFERARREKNVVALHANINYSLVQIARCYLLWQLISTYSISPWLHTDTETARWKVIDWHTHSEWIWLHFFSLPLKQDRLVRRSPRGWANAERGSVCWRVCAERALRAAIWRNLLDVIHSKRKADERRRPPNARLRNISTRSGRDHDPRSVYTHAVYWNTPRTIFKCFQTILNSLDPTSNSYVYR